MCSVDRDGVRALRKGRTASQDGREDLVQTPAPIGCTDLWLTSLAGRCLEPLPRALPVAFKRPLTISGSFRVCWCPRHRGVRRSAG